ncbi:TlpA disulfide reductase family protein [Sphingobacterium sp. UT-1RO-CII-1]|uniref:TlpA family protein disulfide reductase n=1 Tax=Sphingobacterium sp. UT-1RO-CII-1 TaxID=2995225 RepID=UPI00227B32D4|nr:TlpA disulfide reductase family protein [Sphingobacterium sp. UT-1RO-CII-1]MCY4780448.1 TlpA disulfide reductase family protein [Sphingobacterium sp. UT-1RO-CII-1]
MRKKQLIISLGVSLLFFVSACGSPNGDKSNVSEEGKVEASAAADVKAAEPTYLNASFKTAKGETVKLGDFKGKVVVMNFWATWCPPCIIEMPSLDKLALDLKDNDNITFMAVEVDRNLKKAVDFMAKNKYALPLYTLDGDLPQELESSSIPMTVILDKKGEIVAKHTGMLDFGAGKIKENLVELSNE